MPFNPTTGVFTRVSNSFSNPVTGTVIDPDNADELFDDYDLGFNSINGMRLPAVSVNFNTANTDYPIIVALPVGYTRYQLASVRVVNTGTTASLTTATAGLFTDAAGAGAALVASGTALSGCTSNAVNTNGGVAGLTVALATAWLTDTTLFFRVQTAQGAAASGSVSLQIVPLL